MRRFTRLLLLATVAVALAGAAWAQTASYYRIGFRDGQAGSDPDEEFIVMTRDPAVIAVAQAELMLPMSLRSRHVNGYREFDYASGRYNFDGNTPANDWIWQFVPGQWVLAEASIELCDGRPTLYDEMNQFCPWSSFVKSPVIVAAAFSAFTTEWQGWADLVVDWTTTGEVAASHFEIQVTVSDAPGDYETVASEPAAGGPLTTTDYQVVVTGLPGGLNFARVAAFDLDGHYIYSDVRELEPILDVPPGREGLVLLTNHPNPFNPRTALHFSLPRAGQTELIVYALDGRQVKTLWNGPAPDGPSEVVWDGTNETGRRAPSGTYLYRLKSGDEIATSRMMLIE